MPACMAFVAITRASGRRLSHVVPEASVMRGRSGASSRWGSRGAGMPVPRPTSRGVVEPRPWSVTCGP